MTQAKRATRPLLARSLASGASGACLALLGGASLLGCPGSTTTAPYTPITGITISASTLLRGYRCGDGPGEVYKYSAVLWSASASDGGPAGAPLYSDVWDCYVDGVFQNLPSGEAGSETFFIRVFAYTRSGFPTELACPTGYGPTGVPCALLTDASIAEQAGATAQWETTCTATQQSGAPANAVCALLAPEEAGAPGGDAAVEAGPDGSGGDAGAADGADAAEPADASPDAGPDAPQDAQQDAPDALPDALPDATPDAPPG